MRLFFLSSLLGAMASLALGQTAVGSWSGQGIYPVEVRVLDARTKLPLKSVRVWLLTEKDYGAYRVSLADPAGFARDYGPIERFGSRVFTDETGSAKISTSFSVAGGVLSDGSSKTDFRYIRGYLIIEHARYESLKAELESLLPADLKNTDVNAPISVVVRLSEKKASN